MTAGPRVTTVVGVPVPHADRREVVRALAEAGARTTGPRFVFAGAAIVELGGEGGGMALEVYEHDPQLRRAFDVASRRAPLTEAELDAIDGHGACLYLVDEDAGTLAAARRLVRFAEGLLDIGGLGVKVESAGTAHGRAGWQRLARRTDEGALLEAFVALAGSRGREAYTCGMHNLGLPDVDVAQPRDLDEAGHVLWTFARYLVEEQPVLRTGQTFATEVDAPSYRLELGACDRFPADDLFHNPFGVWRLAPA